MDKFLENKEHNPNEFDNLDFSAVDYKTQKLRNNNRTKKAEDKTISRGDLIYADLSPVIGSEQGGVRPVLVIQNDIGNKFSPTTIVAAITSVKNKSNLPTHVKIGDKSSGLPKESVILLEQIRTIDKKRLKDKIGRVSDDFMKTIDEALKISLNLVVK